MENVDDFISAGNQHSYVTSPFSFYVGSALCQFSFQDLWVCAVCVAQGIFWDLGSGLCYSSVLMAFFVLPWFCPVST